MKRIFPLTLQMIEQLFGTQLDQLLLEVEKLNVHEVPMCLRAEGVPAAVCEVAYYESLKYFVEHEEHGRRRFHPSGMLVNPSVQWLHIFEAAGFLKKEPGLYLLWKTEFGSQEMTITEKQARILDQLMDDMLPNFSREEEKDIRGFAEKGIILLQRH